MDVTFTKQGLHLLIVCNPGNYNYDFIVGSLS